MFSFLCLLLTARARPVSLSDTLTLLDQQSPSVHVRRLLEQKKQKELSSLQTQLLPSAQIDMSSMYFGSPLEVNILGEGAEDVDCSSFEAFGFGDLCAGFSKPMVLRDARIFDAKAQVLYPISALYSIFHAYQASSAQLEITKKESEDMRRKLRVQCVAIYTQALVIRKTIEFLEATKTRLQTHQKIDQIH